MIRQKEKLLKETKTDYIFLFLCGFIVFSPVSSYISLNLLKLPLALPELLFIPFYWRFKKIFDFKINKKIFLIGLYIILFLIAIAFIVGKFPVTSILSTVRGYLYMLLVFSLFLNKHISNINNIFYIALGSSIGWMSQGILSVENLVTNVNNDTLDVTVYGNMITLALMIAIPIIYRKKMWIFLTLAISLIISTSVALRRQLLITAITYVGSLLTQMKFNVKRIISLTVVVLFLSIIILNFMPIAEEFTKNVSPVLHRRIFIRTELFLSGDFTEGDQTRFKSIHKFINNIDNYILPHGFVSKRTRLDSNTGIFGIILLFPLFLFFLRHLIFHVINYYKYNNRESALCTNMGIIIIVLLFVEGTFLSYAYATPLTGFVLSRIFSRKNLIH